FGRAGGGNERLSRARGPPGSSGLGNEPGMDPAEMFGAALVLQPEPEIVPAAVRTVKLSTSRFFRRIHSGPSAVRSLDGRGHREVRRKFADVVNRIPCGSRRASP